MSQLQADSLPQLNDVDKILTSSDKLKKLIERHEQSLKQAAISMAAVLGDDQSLTKDNMDSLEKTFITTIALNESVSTYYSNAQNLRTYVSNTLVRIKTTTNNNNNNNSNNNNNTASSLSSSTTTLSGTTSTTSMNSNNNNNNNTTGNANNDLNNNSGRINNSQQLGLGENLADKYLKDDYKKQLDTEKFKGHIKYRDLKREIHAMNHSTPLEGLNDDDDDLVIASQTVNITCPLSQSTLVNPLKSQSCGHVFSGQIILSMFKNSNPIPCPVAGCGKTILKAQLVKSIETEELIKRELRKQAQQRKDQEDITEV